MMPADQASDWSTGASVGPPMDRARTALTVTETGWREAKACSQPGIDDSGTKADEANTSGAMIGNDAAWAASALGAPRPTMANTHDSESENASSTTMPARKATGLVWIRNPTM